ncbi:MAG: sodium:solute symporter family protein [Caedimonas sp.]|nr:sodium:solute symporter family protein [Caedimonas sp.]
MKLSQDTAVWTLLDFWDCVIFLSTLGLTFLSVLYGGFLKKKAQQTENFAAQQNTWTDHILMGRQLTLPLFVSTLVATWYGDILGVTQIAFQHGIYTFVTQGIFWYFSYILFALFLARSIRKMDVVTFPDLLLKLIGTGPARFSAILVFLKTLPVTYAIGVGIFLKTLFPLSFPMAVFIGLCFVFAYTLFGGFGAIVFSDFVQFIFMYAGIVSVVVVSFFQFGGVEYLTGHCPSSHFSLTGSFSVLDTFVWFFIGISTTFLNPTFYQRCLSATSDKVAVRGIFISILFWFGFDVCTTLIGLYAKANLPDANPLNASLMYCLQILPSGLKGLFLGSVLATILSTLDSFLFISSTTLSYDLRFVRFKSKFSSHLFSSLITGTVTFGVALLYEGNFEMAWRMIKGFFAACMFFPFIISFFKPHFVTSQSFTLSCLCVFTGMILWNLYKPFALDAFYVGQILSLGSLIIFKQQDQRMRRQRT